jgi:hypothetical protein
MTSLLFVQQSRAMADPPELYRRTVFVDGTIRQIDASGIELTNAAAFRLERTIAGDVWSVECALFVNHDARTAKHLQIRFAYVGPDGNELGHDTLEVRGTFSTGVPIGAWAAAPRGTLLGQTCQPFVGIEHGIDDDRGSYRRFWHKVLKGSVALAASVNEVDYSDGTSWHKLGLAKDGYLGAFPGTVHQLTASRLEITDVFAAQFGGPTASACVFFVNRAARSVTRARFALAYVAADGTTVGEDVVDVSGTFAPDVIAEAWPVGQTLSPQCRAFNGTIVMRRTSRLGPRLPDEIRYQLGGRPVTLSATVRDVEYDDGTSWHAPAGTFPGP